jgi:hypothetical protein
LLGRRLFGSNWPFLVDGPELGIGIGIDAAAATGHEQGHGRHKSQRPQKLQRPNHSDTQNEMSARQPKL